LHVIKQLTNDFIQSANGNAKKGGLIAFAAVAIGLGSATSEYVEQLLPPVVWCFTDQDMRTRYYACESLYNISKIARGSILAFFNEIFDGLCKLSADPDQNVKNAAMLLDRLVKDIVTEVGSFDVERFVPLLRERIAVTNPFCFPAHDHQILTNRGFMSLDDTLAHVRASPTGKVLAWRGLRVAGYDPASQRLVYRQPRHLVINDNDSQPLVELSQRREHAVWANGASSRAPPGVSVLATPEHEMYARVVADGKATKSFCKSKASALIKASRVRFLTLARNGVDSASFVPASAQTSHDEREFFELCGFAFVHSLTLAHWPLTQSDDVAFVAQRLTACGVDHVVCDDGVHITAGSNNDAWLTQLSDALSSLLALDRCRLRHVVAGMRASDGAIRTTSITQRDTLVHLLLHAGYSASFASDGARGWLVYFADSKAIAMSELRLSDGRDVGAMSVNDGRTWCFDMDDGFVVVRRASAERASRPTIQGNCRMFIVQWLSVLDSVPDIDLLRYLPELLGGLFAMLQDTSAGIRTAVDTLLADFLREIRDEPAAVDLGSLIQTLLAECSAQDDFTRLTALVYVTEFIEIGGKALLPFTAKLVKGVLPSVAHPMDNIAGAAVRANDALLALVRNAAQVDGVLPELLDVLLAIVAPSVGGDGSAAAAAAAAAQDAPTKSIDGAATTASTDASDGAPIAPRLAALRWLTALHALAPGPLGARHGSLLAPLLEAAADGTELLARRALELLATLADDATRLDALLRHVVRRLSRDASLLDNRGALIVRQLCLHVSPERVLRRMASILQTEPDLDFAAVMVDTLNLILLTAPELTSARRKLRGLTEASSGDFFTALYGSWAHSPVALLSLCLLCGVYEHAAQLVALFADVPVTVGFLMQIDKLVQLLESPVFVHLRIQLLEPEAHAYLFKTLYGVLMLLPQSAAFELLRTRLNAVSTLGTLQLIPKSKAAPEGKTEKDAIKFKDLIVHFTTLQQKHQQHFEQRQLAEAKSAVV
jgi:vacuole morphology and inheritance protein 14